VTKHYHADTSTSHEHDRGWERHGHTHRIIDRDSDEDTTYIEFEDEAFFPDTGEKVRLKTWITEYSKYD
jgi:hypothetical protein